MAVKQFDELVAKDNQVGEVIGVDRFLVRVRGLQPINSHALVMFEDGSKGYVHHVYEDYVVILHLGSETLSVGTVAVLQNSQLLARVGRNYIGRVISVMGDPLDGKGPIEPDGSWPVFHSAPMLYERELLDTPLETGVVTLDVLFSLVRGQRMALIGDGKSGKSTLATQIAINQRSTDITTIYVLIGKRRADVIELIDRLESNNALEKTIVIVSTMFDSLVLNYLAPYIAASLGEYLWQHLNMDTLIIYDDLTSHAMTYREISLIAGVSPGRDSYPGDMFYTHSSLVERAGKLNRNHASQTILPIVYAPGGDITAYLPTNVMSMTDGQWILDMAVFREVMRPAINTGLSVTRVGGVGQNKRQKALAVQTTKALAAYKQAEEYAHFGSELSPESTAGLYRGKNLYKLFNQIVGETYSLMAQQLLLDIVINLKPSESIDMGGLKTAVHEYAAKVEDSEEQSNFEAVRDELKAKFLMQAQHQSAEKLPTQPVAPPDNAASAAKPEAEKKEAQKSQKKHFGMLGGLIPHHKEEAKDKSAADKKTPKNKKEEKK